MIFSSNLFNWEATSHSLSCLESINSKTNQMFRRNTNQPLHNGIRESIWPISMTSHLISPNHQKTGAREWKVSKQDYLKQVKLSVLTYLILLVLPRSMEELLQVRSVKVRHHWSRRSQRNNLVWKSCRCSVKSQQQRRRRSQTCDEHLILKIKEFSTWNYP
jgi:hypothetical protein